MELISATLSLLSSMHKLEQRNIESEITTKATRSSGPGGQHVNKVSTRIEAYLNIADSKILSATEKDLLIRKLGGRLDKEKGLRVIDQGSRSQIKNKRNAIQKLISLLEQALVKNKKRIPTKISAAKKKEILETKRKRSLVKKMRGPIKSSDFS